MYRKISRENLSRWLAEQQGGGQVLAPAREKGIWGYGDFAGTDLPRGFQNSRLPLKAWFFESYRALFEWRAPAGQPPGLHPSPPPEGRRLIFGVRACDARSLKILERVFDGEYRDAFYLSQLSRTILLGEACRKPCPGGFCQEMGIDPRDSAEVDVFFREADDGYLARGITEKGRALLKDGRFTEAPAEAWEAARGAWPGGRESPLFNLDKVRARVTERFQDESIWQEVSKRCINCGVCTYLCPTCHCFDLCDLQAPGQAVRFRRWDGCAFPDFTRMPAHNPRREKWRRYRQRVSHKFNYFFQNHEVPGCVGCGRCVAHCPVNLDLREVLGEVSK